MFISSGPSHNLALTSSLNFSKSASLFCHKLLRFNDPRSDSSKRRQRSLRSSPRLTVDELCVLDLTSSRTAAHGVAVGTSTLWKTHLGLASR